eukprot:TRINITY_DN57_c0_g2_i2.p1 TRINITY_DN57_c0_g2~~TRINITY_DN57_c0_g2_i2.p1  ORF type:complete len:105 (+),score=3.51 TRINITY_DN57_c0_g2_i2:103-417(+)
MNINNSNPIVQWARLSNQLNIFCGEGNWIVQTVNLMTDVDQTVDGYWSAQSVAIGKLTANGTIVQGEGSASFLHQNMFRAKENAETRAKASCFAACAQTYLLGE